MSNKIWLVLGGWWSKWIAHIGVLKKIEKYNIKISAISWTSIWAIIGALYASGKSAKQIENLLLQKKSMDFFDKSFFSFSRLWIVQTNSLKKIVEDFMECENFEDLKYPLNICAYNISKWETTNFNTWNIFDAIRASISVPGIYSPHQINNEYYIDWWLSNQIPFDILPSYINKYLMVNVSSPILYKNKEDIDLRNLLNNSVTIMQIENFKSKLKNLNDNDYVLLNPDVSKYSMFENNSKFKEIIKLWEIEFEKNTNKIKKL